jgi:predicted Rossmann-fold nucleotide-binding protein
VEGWARPLVAVIDHAIEQGFADPGCRSLFEVVDGVPALLLRLGSLPAGRGGPGDRF